MAYRFVTTKSTFSRAASLGWMSVAALTIATIASSATPFGGAGQGSPLPPPTPGMHLEIKEGSASYSVREQLMGIDFPNDAVGTSPTVAGTIGINKDGSIAPGSKLTVDLRNLKSEQAQRDDFLRTHTFETDKYPLAEFVPTKVTGLPLMIPLDGQAGFLLTGDLTIHGVTKPVTFQGIATFRRNYEVAGQAKTSFTLETFSLERPMVSRVLSVDDKIDLSLSFIFKRS